jgi:hypothetical protein
VGPALIVGRAKILREELLKAALKEGELVITDWVKRNAENRALRVASFEKWDTQPEGRSLPTLF